MNQNEMYMKSRVCFNILTLMCITFLISSCDKGIKGSGDVVHMERSVPSFHSVRLKGSFNIFIRQDSVQKVEVVTDDNIIPYVETDVRGGVLEVGIRSGTNIRKTTRSDVFISLPSLQSVVLDGSGNIRGENRFTGNYLELNLKGSGMLSFEFEGASLKSVIDGSGNIELKGNSDNAIFEIGGSGNINAYSFTSKNATASIKGSGNITAHVTENLNASVSGSGSITYIGNPIVHSSVTGSGSIGK